MTSWRDAKFRDDETWACVRRDWEAGETGASLALRYDVGLANLWRRRAAEGWNRRRKPDPTPTPPEGWDEHARRKLAAWEARMEAERDLAESLMRAVAEDPMGDVSVWHLGWLLHMRAERRGEAVAARDRAGVADQPWADCFWDDEGRLRSPGQIDYRVLQFWREEWRREAGLPDGVAETWPAPPPADRTWSGEGRAEP